MHHQSRVEQHDGSQLAGLGVDRLQLLVGVLYAEHQLQVALAGAVEHALVEFWVGEGVLVVCSCFQRLWYIFTLFLRLSLRRMSCESNSLD